MELSLHTRGQGLHVRPPNMTAARGNTVCCSPGRAKTPGRKAMGQSLSQSWRYQTMTLLPQEIAQMQHIAPNDCTRRAL